VMCASATAGMLARLPCHPLDTAKAKMQANIAAPGAHPSLVSVLRETIRAQGFRGLYAGFWVTFVGSAPAACTYFTSYEFLKPFLGKVNSKIFELDSMTNHFSAGLLAEAISCVLWVPIDVVKERLQVQSLIPPEFSSTRYKGNLDAIITIAK